MMDGDGARATAGVSAKVAPPNPTERLSQALERLEGTVDALQQVCHRVHDKSYGEHQPSPRAEDDAPEFGGRIGELHERVRAIQASAERTTEIMESMENNG